LALQQNVLGGAARNFGVRASTGDVLFFLDSDDIYHANHIPLCWAALITHPDVGLVTNTEYFSYFSFINIYLFILFYPFYQKLFSLFLICCFSILESFPFSFMHFWLTTLSIFNRLRLKQILMYPTCIQHGKSESNGQSPTPNA